ncbi:MAG: hypothetical protein WDN07_00140 [Actinomycetota bacterium]
MELTAILCNHVETPNGLLYVSGGGIDRITVPKGAPSPWPINVAIAVQVKVPWDLTNRDHTLHIRLQDIDGQNVLLPTGPETFGPFKAEMNFKVGRPSGLEPGEWQVINFGFNMPMLPIPRLGSYVFTCEIDEEELERARFKVNQAD